jgi:GNAT superfamily N-acetyltransferase
MELKRKIAPTQQELDVLQENAWRHHLENHSVRNASPRYASFLFSACEDATLAGGISGSIYWNGLEIDTLWVHEEFRGRRLGAILVSVAEEYARHCGAVIACLRTGEALEFYEKQGYQVLGTLEDRPAGAILYYMKKRLDTNPPG